MQEAGLGEFMCKAFGRGFATKVASAPKVRRLLLKSKEKLSLVAKPLVEALHIN